MPEKLSGRVAPPTAHLRVPDPACDLDYLARGARPLPALNAVMSNSFAFGGTNASLIAQRAGGDTSQPPGAPQQ